MRRRLYRWLVPDEAIRSIGFVRWRLVDHSDDALAFGAELAAAFDLPWAAVSPAPPDWRPWPTLADIEDEMGRQLERAYLRGFVSLERFWQDMGFAD